MGYLKITQGSLSLASRKTARQGVLRNISIRLDNGRSSQMSQHVLTAEATEYRLLQYGIFFKSAREKNTNFWSKLSLFSAA